MNAAVLAALGFDLSYKASCKAIVVIGGAWWLQAYGPQPSSDSHFETSILPTKDAP